MRLRDSDTGTVLSEVDGQYDEGMLNPMQTNQNRFVMKGLIQGTKRAGLMNRGTRNIGWLRGQSVSSLPLLARRHRLDESSPLVDLPE